MVTAWELRTVMPSQMAAANAAFLRVLLIAMMIVIFHHGGPHGAITTTTMLVLSGLAAGPAALANAHSAAAATLRPAGRYPENSEGRVIRHRPPGASGMIICMPIRRVYRQGRAEPPPPERSGSLRRSSSAGPGADLCNLPTTTRSSPSTRLPAIRTHAAQVPTQL